MHEVRIINTVVTIIDLKWDDPLHGIIKIRVLRLWLIPLGLIVGRPIFELKYLLDDSGLTLDYLLVQLSFLLMLCVFMKNLLVDSCIINCDRLFSLNVNDVVDDALPKLLWGKITMEVNMPFGFVAINIIETILYQV